MNGAGILAGMGVRVDLPEFRRALEENPAAAGELTFETGRRYYRGELPGVVLWLLRHPKMLVALLAAARRLTEEEREALRRRPSGE